MGAQKMATKNTRVERDPRETTKVKKENGPAQSMVRSQSTTVKSQSTTARSQRVQRVTSQRKMSKLSRTMKSHTLNLIPKMEKKMPERERKAKATKVAKVAKAAKAARARRMVTSQKKLPKPKREDAEDLRVERDPRATTMAKDPAQKVTSQRDHPRMT